MHHTVEFWVFTSRSIWALLHQGGWARRLEEAGVKILTDTCALVSDLEAWRFESAMTNSGKFAFYAPSILGLEICFGSFEECVNTAVEGRLWRAVDRR